MAQSPSEASSVLDGLWAELQDTLTATLNKKELKKVRRIEDRDSLESFFEEVKKACDEYKDGGRSRGRRFKMGFQTFCARFSEFLECFAGIGDIVKGAFKQGGALAYGSLATLLMIVRNKHDREEKISTYLLRAKRSLADLKDWQNIYNPTSSPKFTEAIIGVYKTVFQFTIRTWRYYNGRWYYRWLNIRTAKFGIERDLDDLRDVVKRITIETGKLHHAEQARIYRRLEDQREREWKDHLLSVRHRLGCPETDDPKQRSQCLKETWRKLIEDDQQTYETMVIGSVQTLQGHQEYMQWHKSPKAGMLLLSALNHQDTSASDPSWLSSAVSGFALDLQDQGDKVIFHVVKSRKETPDMALKLAICEILGWDYAFWEDQKSAVDTGVQDNAVVRVFVGLVSAWTAAHPDQPIYLVLDGINMWLQEGADSVEGSWRYVLNCLMDCVHDTRALKLCMLGEHNSQSKQVFWFMDLECAFKGLKSMFWHIEGWRQPASSAPEN